jgi:hypothetical protein
MVASNENIPPEDSGADDGPLQDRGLTPRQEQAILALINEATVAKASVATGIPERTIFNWLGDPKFSRIFRDTRRQSFTQAVGLANYYASMAVQTLAKVMVDGQAPPHARVTAATNLLRFGREAIELDDMCGRIESLEQAQQQASANFPGRRFGHAS